MHRAFTNLVRHADVGIDEALRMCSLYPARAMNLEGQYGKIAPGNPAQFVVLDQELNLLHTIG
jgi:N-acetylglucosamine-6-phosphate deacetylase